MSASYPPDAMDLPPFPDHHGSGADELPPTNPVAGPASEPYAVFWVDLTGRVTRWAESCAEVFGQSRAEAPEWFRDLFRSEERRRGIPGLILRHARDVGSWDGTGWRLRQGAAFWAASSVSLVRTPNGLDIGFMVVTRDLSRLNAVSGPAVDSEQARLASLGRVASEVTHDVRNILAAIRGFAGALEKLQPSSGASDVVRAELLKACDRGTLLTQRLLGVGKEEPRVAECTDLGAVVRGARPLLRQVLPSRIRLRTEVEEGLPGVRTRTADVELALLNLVINARDAMPDRGLVEVRAHSMNGPEGRTFVLTVRDTGEGMSPETLERCRERSYSTKADEHGCGLGLAIVEETATEFGGTFRIDSELGVGTSASMTFRPFTDLLPGVVAAETAEADELAAGPTAILWASSPVVSELLAGLLKRNGFPTLRVRSAEDADEAARALGTRASLLLVEGKAAAEQCGGVVAALPESAGSVLLTDVAIDHDIAHVFDHQLVGPMDPDALLACLSEVRQRGASSVSRSIH